MPARFLRSICGLALAMGLTLAFAGQASAASFITVCPAGPPTCDFTTLQGAVGAAASGDTISVGQGNYSGTVTITQPGLTLLGDQAGNDARTRPLASPESILSGQIDVQASHTVIDGFKFEHGQPGVQLRPTGSDYTVINNIFDDNDFGIYAHSDGVDPSLIRHNLFTDNQFNPFSSGAGNGIYSDQGVSRLTVDENKFLGNQNAAVLITHTTPGTPDSEITITDNVADSFGALKNGPLAFITRSKDVTIEHNTSTDSFGSGIFLEGNNGVDVLKNTITGVSDGFSAIRLQIGVVGTAPNQNVNIIGNTIKDNNQGPSTPTYGIRVADGSTLGRVDAHFNRIVGNGVGARDEDADPGDRIDAENNWWGCNAGPGNPGCDSKLGNVDSDPWLVLSTDASPSSIPTGGSTSQIETDLRHNSNGDFFAAPPFPDGGSIPFTASLGSVASPRTLALGSVHTVLTSGSTAGTSTVGSTFDNQSVSTPVKFESPPSPPPAGPQGPSGPQGPPGQTIIVPSTPAPGTGVAGFVLSAPRSEPASNGLVFVDAKAGEAAFYTTRSTITVPSLPRTRTRPGVHTRHFKLAKVTTPTGQPGQTLRIQIPLGGRALQAVLDALARGHRSSARVTVTAQNLAGNKQTAAQTVRLRR